MLPGHSSLIRSNRTALLFAGVAAGFAGFAAIRWVSRTAAPASDDLEALKGKLKGLDPHNLPNDFLLEIAELIANLAEPTLGGPERIEAALRASAARVAGRMNLKVASLEAQLASACRRDADFGRRIVERVRTRLVPPAKKERTPQSKEEVLEVLERVKIEAAEILKKRIDEKDPVVLCCIKLLSINEALAASGGVLIDEEMLLPFKGDPQVESCLQGIRDLLAKEN